MKSMMKTALLGLLLAGSWHCRGGNPGFLDLRFSDLGWGKLDQEVWNPPTDQTVVRIQYEHRVVLPPTKEYVVFYFVEKFYEEDYLPKVNAIYEEIRKICPGSEIHPENIPIKPAKDPTKDIVWQDITAVLPVGNPLLGDQLVDWWTLRDSGMSQLSLSCFYALDDTTELQSLMREKSFAQGKELLASLAQRMHGSLAESPLLARYSIDCGSEYQVAPIQMGDIIHPLATPDREKITVNCLMDLAFAAKLPQDEVAGASKRPERLIRKNFTCRFKPDTACLVLLLTAQGDNMSMDEENIAGRRERLKQIILRDVPTAEFQEWTMQMDIVPLHLAMSRVYISRVLLVLLPADASLVAKIVEEAEPVMGANVEKNTKVVYGVRHGEMVWQKWIDTIWRELRYPPDKKVGQPPRRIRYFCSSDLDMPYRLIYDNGMIRLPLAFYGFSPESFEVTGEFEAIVQE
ncbi:hypothetical protein SDC9_68459 [bioreactor metagenome]|uniref:Uncharacterized protein n=1 Tax=bioreactor metagenome TaxID=1076179 RepID=A0A644Y0X9_9ZZZZ